MDRLTASIDAVHSLIERLQQGDGEHVAGLSGHLESIGISLRDAQLRSRACEGFLARDVLTIARIGAAKTSSDWDDVLFQAGRVAANMTPDCDAGRDALIEAGYKDIIVGCLGSHVSSQARLAFAASLLNLVSEHHSKATEALADWRILERLVYYANQAYPENTTIYRYMWGALSAIIEDFAAQLAPQADQYLPEFQKALDNFDGNEENEETYLLILNAISSLFETEQVGKRHLLSIGNALVRVVELPGASNTAVKASSNLLVEVLGLAELDDAMWTKAGEWIQSDNEQLIAIGLLILGNSTKSDSSASRMTRFIPIALRLVVPETSHLILHSLVGFLRNLSVAPPNRQLLASAKVLDKLISIGAWDKKMDLMGSVQGGTVVLAKNLCNEKDSALSFLENQENVNKLLALMERTDEQPLRIEATRLFINIVRTLSKNERLALVPPLDEKIIDYFAYLLRETKHPLLINESIVALVFAATVFKQQRDVGRALLNKNQNEESAFEKLQTVLLGSKEEDFADEISQNAQVLLNTVAQGPGPEDSRRNILIGVGGSSCSGKTLLAKHLAQVLPASSILHQDDFAPTEKEVPFSKQYPDLQDWDDPPTAILWPRFHSALCNIKEKGKLPDKASNEDLNKQVQVGVDPLVKEQWKRKFERLLPEARWFIVDGFILFWDQEVQNSLDIKVFLRVPRDTLKQRREARKTYVLHNPSDPDAGGVWEDPPGYFDKIVYPAYVKSHQRIFKDGNVETGQVVCSDIQVVEPKEGDLTEAFQQVCQAIEAFAYRL